MQFLRPQPPQNTLEQWGPLPTPNRSPKVSLRTHVRQQCLDLRMPAPKLDLPPPGRFGLTTAIRVLAVVNGFPQLPKRRGGWKSFKNNILEDEIHLSLSEILFVLSAHKIASQVQRHIQLEIRPLF